MVAEGLLTVDSKWYTKVNPREESLADKLKQYKVSLDVYSEFYNMDSPDTVKSSQR